MICTHDLDTYIMIGLHDLQIWFTHLYEHYKSVYQVFRTPKIMEKGKLEKPTLDYDDGEELEFEICVTLKMVMVMKLI